MNGGNRGFVSQHRELDFQECGFLLVSSKKKKTTQPRVCVGFVFMVSSFSLRLFREIGGRNPENGFLIAASTEWAEGSKKTFSETSSSLVFTPLIMRMFGFKVPHRPFGTVCRMLWGAFPVLPSRLPSGSKRSTWQNNSGVPTQPSTAWGRTPSSAPWHEDAMIQRQTDLRRRKGREKEDVVGW